MDTATRIVAANLAASLLMSLLFFVLLATAVALFLAWRGLRLVRALLPDYIVQAQGYAEIAARRSQETTDRVLRRHLAYSSRWAGIKAGVRALFSLSTGGRVAPPPPPGVGPEPPPAG